MAERASYLHSRTAIPEYFKTQPSLVGVRLLDTVPVFHMHYSASFSWQPYEVEVSILIL